LLEAELLKRKLLLFVELSVNFVLVLARNVSLTAALVDIAGFLQAG